MTERTPSALRLWYDRPAHGADEHEAWERWSLPIGNGALGASVFGRVGRERIAVNEKTLWTGGPGGADGYDHGLWPSPRPGVLDEIREHMDERGGIEPKVAADRLGNPAYAVHGRIPGFGAYQPFGDIWLDVPGAEATSDYRRELDIQHAIARTRYTADGVRHVREHFASYPAHAVVLRLRADAPGSVSCTVGFSSELGPVLSAVDGRITIRGRVPDNSRIYEGQIQVLAEGGSRVDGAGKVTVSGADAVSVIFSAATDYADSYPAYVGDDPHERVTGWVERAAATPYADLLGSHVADHTALFDRVCLDIGQRIPDVATDVMRESYGGGGPADRALEALAFQYGRYLLIASSRDNSPLPANLQGVWNDSTAPAWEADYHTNINIQMNYWQAETTNLAETVDPLLRFVDALRPPGRVAAREMWGANGWVVSQNTNPFGFVGLHDWPESFWFPEANAWLAQHVVERYRFSGDLGFLRERAYPVLKETCEFWLDFLVQDPRDGSLVVSPSFSPEHGVYTAGAAISQQIIWDLFTNTVEACELLGVDAEFRDRLRAAVEKLDKGLRVGGWGQLQEWKSDLDDPTNEHRHVSHLFALHPGRQISPRTTPEYADAAQVTLEHRGDGGTGWSKAWKMSFWARLLNGDRALSMYAGQLADSTLPNLWGTHPPFQIDGNLGATAGVAEMLLQSHDGTIDVLPALPSAWRTGSFDGLRARGGFTVGVTWRDGVPLEIRLRSDIGGIARVRIGGGPEVMELDTAACAEYRIPAGPDAAGQGR